MLFRSSTKKALNVDENHSHHWAACNFMINSKFHVDWMKDFSHYVADLLDAGYPALIYAGDVDFICNYLGKLFCFVVSNNQPCFQDTELDTINRKSLTHSLVTFRKRGMDEKS